MSGRATEPQLKWELEAEIERLRAELDKAHRLIGQSIQWQRDAESKLLILRAENERLRVRADNKLLRSGMLEAEAEIERLRAERDHWRSLVSRADRAQFPFDGGNNAAEAGKVAQGGVG